MAASVVLLHFNAQPAALKSPFTARELRQLTLILLASFWSVVAKRERESEMHRVMLGSGDNAHALGA